MDPFKDYCADVFRWLKMGQKGLKLDQMGLKIEAKTSVFDQNYFFFSENNFEENICADSGTPPPLYRKKSN